MIFAITIISLVVVFLVFLGLLLWRLEKFLKEIILVLKSKDFYEAKEVLGEKEEAPADETKEIPLEESDPEKVLELLQKEEEKLYF
jgi:hypothetical protein